MQTLFHDYRQSAVVEDTQQVGSHSGRKQWTRERASAFLFLLSDSEYFSILDHVAVLIKSMGGHLTLINI